MSTDGTAGEDYLDAARLDILETRLVREGKALCGQCNEPISFHYDDKVWIDDGNRHRCKGTMSDHVPRAGTPSHGASV